MNEKRKIMIIDDDNEFIELFNEKIKYLDVDYSIISNSYFKEEIGQKHDEFISDINSKISENREQIAAIFLDLGFDKNKDEPWREGFLLGKQLRMEFYEIPILILTQYKSDDVVASGFFYDFDAFIGKDEFSQKKMDADRIEGIITRSLKKREELINNLPIYYEKHLKRTNEKPIQSFVSAFNSNFIFKGNYLEQTLDSSINIENYFSNKKEVTGVLFADLVNSSKIKEENSFCEGLLVTRIHNQIITKNIEKYKGVVVKYIGDCVMARFDYNNENEVNCDSINCAIRIQEELDAWNKKTKRKEPIQTTIGISAGVVADFYGNDPQGSDVDLAARLESQARPHEILISDGLYSLINAAQITSKIGKAKNFSTSEYVSKPKKGKFKGFSGTQTYYSITYD